MRVQPYSRGLTSPQAFEGTFAIRCGEEYESVEQGVKSFSRSSHPFLLLLTVLLAAFLLRRRSLGSRAATPASLVWDTMLAMAEINTTRRRISAATVLLPFLLVASAGAQLTSPPASIAVEPRMIDNLAHESARRQDIPGLTLAVVDHGQVV